MSFRNLIITMLVLSLPACVQSPNESQKMTDEDDKKAANYYSALDSDKGALTFSVSFSTDNIAQGNIPAGIDLGDSPSDFGTAEKLIRALESCGETRATIDLGWSQTEFVSVPIGRNNPFREASLDDLALVKCAQEHATFAFDAAYGTIAQPRSGLNSFKSLHAQHN